ncbi:MAG TPA: helix-hairpin-helix domain-containing protein [Brumimicrobium sp.]|nr:helix-hairpin-helix domain-containing protein [Brumimicrobium sp.]
MAKKKWDSDWIHFSKRARRGIFVLLLLFVAVAVSPRLYYNYIYTPRDYNVKISAIDIPVEDSNYVEQSRYNQPKEMFDPNTYTLDEWMTVGLSEKQAKSILKYLNNGAQLKVKSDLKKLYVVDEVLYGLLEPKIDLPDAVERTNYPKNKNYDKYIRDSTYNKTQFDKKLDETSEINPVSVNKASVRELQTIPGIGPFFAKEIIKIRESYGGIISSDQLLDIYKMDEEKLKEISPYLIIDKHEVNKLNINTASEEQLRQHPLISRDMAKSIVFFRENHKKYGSLNDLLLSPYIDIKVLKTISPYLKVE